MFENNLIAGVSGQGGGYNIEDSLRFNDNDSAYLSRTPSVAGNRKTWTWSGWVKRGNLGTKQVIFLANNSGTDYVTYLGFTASNQIIVYMKNAADTVNRTYLLTSALFRDASGWYHITVNFDTTQATANQRASLFVNGEKISSFATETYAPLNFEGLINSTVVHTSGANYYGGAYYDYLDGYMAEVNFIDGQALTPASFGQVDATTGEWSPKAYSGTYGTNGFYLPFSGNANDSSGNGNNWTENNLASTDYMIDTPTNNFSTLNPLASNTSLIPIANTFSEGNLKIAQTASFYAGSQSTISIPSSGKWYVECCLQTVPAANTNGAFGIWTYSPSSLNYYYDTPYTGTGIVVKDGVLTTGVGAASSGDIVTIEIDVDGGTAQLKRNGVNISTPYTLTSGVSYFIIYIGWGHTGSYVYNFGQDSSFAGNKTRQGNTDANGIGDFYYTPPAGYLALCTDNLPAPAIEQPETQFNVVTYTGNGTSQAITGVGFQPDMVWIKVRSTNYDHQIHDSVRGAGLGLLTNDTVAEADYNSVTSFDSDGFTVNVDGSFVGTNASGQTFVAWCWKAGGTAVTNTDGTITSQVSANVDAGFSIVGYTGTGATATLGHGLSQAPEVMIVKNRSGVVSGGIWWLVYTTAIDGTNDYLRLDSTDASGNSTESLPTSTVFSIAGGTLAGASGAEYIAYCFHSVEGFSKIGTYVGNGSANGPFVYTGFKPAFLMVKRTDSTSPWLIYDNERNTFNQTDNLLRANTSQAETGSGELDFLSNGFKYRGSSTNADYVTNISGGTYIYMAFAEHPFNYATGR